MKIKRRVFAAGLGAMIATPSYAAAKFHVPGEDRPQKSVFMQWPVSRRVYGYGSLLSRSQKSIALIANTISDFQPVIMLAAESDHTALRSLVSSEVELWDVPTEDLWCRDSGPLFSRDGAGNEVVQSLNFNGWGRKQVHSRDGQVAKRVAQKLGLPFSNAPITGEPGGVDHDGYDTLIAHASSWHIDNRNRGKSLDDLTQALQDTYGVNEVIWAPGLKNQDITDYHIDSLARFVGKRRALIQLPDAPDAHDPFLQTAFVTHEKLKQAGLQITILPEPENPRIRHAEFVASYANFFLCNGAVISAQFGDPRTDPIAKDVLSSSFPGREIVQINVDVLGGLGGGVHCATQQRPA